MRLAGSARLAASLPLVLGPLLLLLPRRAAADVKFTKPEAGATLRGGGALTVQWEDSGDAPAIDDLTTYQLFLCAGGNEEGSFIQLTSITTQGSFGTGNRAEGTVSTGIGDDDENAYFLKMISVAATGGTVTNYSPRFTLTGMTGTFPPAVQAGIDDLTGTSGPDTVNEVADDAAAAGPVDADLFDVPFQSQTGLTRYAPMMAVPPTQITRRTKTPLFPTSSVELAKTWLPTARVQTTVTQSQTFSVKSIENPATAAAMPDDDMQKFLNRWKD
ncbi:hypothetical protein BDY21DRAFT_387237 [Lineolata rhizophorae]|uniref:Uncharacterized protein n=1 Tax=Lineolata rhizophorae TaxID=578093 RepID=A0A6A6NV77_9PEZI|nr:hypothetical protein BDY21DRAFT_387237 [Lineolata rhizophorae]